MSAAQITDAGRDKGSDGDARALVRIPILKDARHHHLRTAFRPRDNWCVGDTRSCLKLEPGTDLDFAFDIPEPLEGVAEVVIRACLQIYDSHAYVYKHINSILEIRVNGTAIFDGVHHWRSHEETVAFWNPFDFRFPASLLKPGRNTVAIRNKTTREGLGECFDRRLEETLGEAEAMRLLGVMYLSHLDVNLVRPYPVYPALLGVPRTAIAGRPFIVEVAEKESGKPVEAVSSSNARIEALGGETEFGAFRSLFAVAPETAGAPCTFAFQASGESLKGVVGRVYEDRGSKTLDIGIGAECMYSNAYEEMLTDAFALQNGNAMRISIDGFLGDLHHCEPDRMFEFIRYLARRRWHYQLNWSRVPPYTRITPGHVKAMGDIGGRALFGGVALVEPITALGGPGSVRAAPFPADTQDGEGDAGKTLRGYLETYLDGFRREVERVRAPGHRVVTFDAAGPMCGHYFEAGLDAHLTELGPCCNVLEEICCRGAATAFGKPWGVATAMHWYCGQGAQYAHDDARVRYAQLVMHSSYLAGANQIFWEGGAFQNLPVYNYILSEETWRDYGRRYNDATPRAIRDCFGQTLDFHHEHQLPSPKVRFGVIHGTNDLFRGLYDGSMSSLHDMSLARSWTLLKVWLPHVSWGRGATDPGRRQRRWYSWTPYGQVDVLPAKAEQKRYDAYGLLALLGWNTMTDAMWTKLVGYVTNGGTLFLSLPHLVTDEKQVHEWSFYRGGDVAALCGIRVKDLGPRLEKVRFLTNAFRRHLPETLVLSEKHPLFVESYGEDQPVFGVDVSYFNGEIEVLDAEVLAVSQRDEPVLLRKRLGRGSVYLLNTYHHPGRGRLLDLAEGVLRTLVEDQPAPLRMEDPSERVAWFEYNGKDNRCFFFLDTDWTQADHRSTISIKSGDTTLTFEVPAGHPVRLNAVAGTIQ